MPEAWIGAGGWGYFRGPVGRPLEDYARAFRFAEVNVTFYRHPALTTVRQWRRSVPVGFRFAVKAHRIVTHRARLRPTREAVRALERDVEIVRALGSDVLVLQAPVELTFGPEEAKGFRDLASTLPSRMRVALEARAHRAGPLPRPLANALGDLHGIDVVDLSRGEEPRVASDILYTRLFGASDGNVWEFSDDELRAIGDAADEHEVDRVVFTFHGVRMYKDAARFLAFRSTGQFPSATEARGHEAVREVLAPDVRWPVAREDLIRDHGWKVVTLADGRNVHARELLRALPDGRYSSLDEVVHAFPNPSAAGSFTLRGEL